MGKLLIVDKLAGYAAYTGVCGPLAKPSAQFLHGTDLTADNHFDTAIEEIFGIAGEPQLLGLISGGSAEKDPLYPASHQATHADRAGIAGFIHPSILPLPSPRTATPSRPGGQS